jgi:curved DNA-binding protein CbpA
MSKKIFKSRLGRIIIVGVILILIASISGFFYAKQSRSNPIDQYQTSAENDPYVRFVMEAYDGIATNYWMKPGEYKKHNLLELPGLFGLSVKKAANLIQTPVATDRTSTAEMLAPIFSNATSTQAKKQLATEIVNIVAYNLLPIGRDSLYSMEQQVALRERVSNVDPTKDLYGDLGVQKDASAKVIEKNYQEKAIVLKNATSTEAKAELAQITYAKNVLSNSNSRALYDDKKIEPTLFSHIFGSTLYLHIKQISPTTLFEFGNAVSNASTTLGINSMIIDLRGNIGGDLDFASNFAGLFIGPNQYAYDLFRKEDYQPQRTMTSKFNELSRFGEIAILTDNRTQSTAELTTAIMKRLNLAKVVGEATAGWGTIENTYPLHSVIDPAEKYALFLVNNITLGDSNQPIEGNGIVPNVNVSKADWKSQLKNYFSSPTLINVIRERVASAPLNY